MDFDRLVQYGLPTVLLGWLCYALWQGVKWGGVNVAIPMRDRIIKHFDELERLFGAIQENGTRQTEILERIEDGLSRNSVCRAPYPTPYKPT